MSEQLELVSGGEPPDNFRWLSPPAQRNRVLAAIEWCEQALTALLTMGILGALLLQIVSRRFFVPVNGTDEFARYANIILGFAGAVVAMASYTHIKVDIFDVMLSGRVLRYLKVVSLSLVAAVLLVVAWVSYPYVLTMADRSSVALNIPLVWIYGTAVVLLLLQAFHALVWLREDWITRDSEERVGDDV